VWLPFLTSGAYHQYVVVKKWKTMQSAHNKETHAERGTLWMARRNETGLALEWPSPYITDLFGGERRILRFMIKTLLNEKTTQ